jgi:hypothetical protein
MTTKNDIIKYFEEINYVNEEVYLFYIKKKGI